VLISHDAVDPQLGPSPTIEIFEGALSDSSGVSDKQLKSTSIPPPELRFPSGGILGQYAIVAGSAGTSGDDNPLSIWTLNIQTLEWSSIDLGKAFSSGVWHTAKVWEAKNQLIVFGRHGNASSGDRSRLAYSWTHVITTDLETFGVYQPPRHDVDVRTQLSGLDALSKGVNADFTMVCDDGRELRCSRKVLEERWPWFRVQRNLLLQQAVSAVSLFQDDRPEYVEVTRAMPADDRMSLRRLELGQPYAVTLALLQFLYTTTLLTPLQLAPPVLSTLLVLSLDYELPRLQELVKHAMHVALSLSTAWGVCEVAHACGCHGLERRYALPVAGVGTKLI